MLSIEGNLVNLDGTARGRVEIGDDGIISRVSESTGQADIVLKDELVFPGFIDIHVHARECADHSWDYKEDFTTAGQAAINGGVVAFADMPNNPVPPVDEESYGKKYQLARKSAVDVLLYAGIGPKTKPLSSPIGVVPYKVFMGQSIGNLFFSSRGELEKVLESYHGQSVSFHCEDPGILDANKNRPTHESRRPAQAETSAVELALALIKKFALAGKICHVSTAAGYAKIAAAKKANLPVTVEVSPHHLFYDESNITGANHEFMQMNPPLRTPQDRKILIDALREGAIDYLATDHAPHTIEEKQLGTSGTPQLDTYGPLVSWLMEDQGFTPQDIARVCCYNPGRWLSRFSSMQFGEIKQGFAGSLTILDPNRPITIQKSLLKTKCNWSPFEGVTFPGRVVYTIIRGKIYK